MSCRTEALGGHLEQCDHPGCGYENHAYNSCRNRNCPKCQYSTRHLWVGNRVKELLPVPYFHMVFTIPHIFNDLVLLNRELMFNILFDATQETVKTLFQSRYGATPGLISLLHTWGSALGHHTHVHILLTGGGLKSEIIDGVKVESWVETPENYALPIESLKTVYRAIFTKKIMKRKSQLKLPDEMARQPYGLKNLIDKSFEKEWIVYAKAPFLGPVQCLNYLGNYTHRVAISNNRIVKVEGDFVTFKTKKYKKGGYEQGVTTLRITEFLRRFLMHIIPKGFVKIRFYGFMAHRHRKTNIKKIRELISQKKGVPCELTEEKLETIISEFNKDIPLNPCPKCKIGTMIRIAEIQGQPRGRFDTS